MKGEITGSYPVQSLQYNLVEDPCISSSVGLDSTFLTTNNADDNGVFGCTIHYLDTISCKSSDQIFPAARLQKKAIK